MSDERQENAPAVLMIAYACDPDGSGEHWLGWEWAVQAAKSHRLHLITTPKAKDAILREAPKLGIVPHFVSIGEIFRRLTSSKIGSASAWIRKHLWQRNAFALALRLHAETPFALVHQTTFHTFRVPFLASELPVASVWGPIAGGESVPAGFDEFLGPGAFSERMRIWINRASLLVPGVLKTLRKTEVLWVSNRVSRDFLPEDCRSKVTVVPPNALRAEDLIATEPLVETGKTDRPFTLLYVGNCVATRALPIVFAALKKANLSRPWELQIVGSGPAIPFWKEEVQRLGLSDHVRFVGLVRREALDEFYRNADALVFPALRDSGGSALLEAMSKMLPVICLDWGGPGEMLGDEDGIKISVKSPQQTVAEMATAFERLACDPEWGRRLAKNAATNVRERFSWAAKRKLLEETYGQLIGR